MYYGKALIFYNVVDTMETCYHSSINILRKTIINIFYIVREEILLHYT